ncbi:hypothetical protein AALO_G00032770 [Alosa alosa]|uniref:Uncharacterized protein n=1 Tax=Alosa alosa TaxID=278164 RepID=A0AAV6HCA8_9TELE|nr:hypothetical protein AALO_G00032770 [Alosa alosa]
MFDNVSDTPARSAADPERPGLKACPNARSVVFCFYDEATQETIYPQTRTTALRRTKGERRQRVRAVKHPEELAS